MSGRDSRGDGRTRGWQQNEEDEAENEERLLETVAVKVARMLNLPSENRLLAQQIVRAARASSDDFLGFTTSLSHTFNCCL